MQTFDQVFGLPDPPSFAVDYPLGPVVYNSGNADYVGGARETTLDVEWAHAIAPGANIVLLVSPVNQANGIQGLPEIEQLFEYAMDNHLGQVISMSFGASEPTLVGDPCNENLRKGEDLLKAFDQNVFQRAMTEFITILDASGDAGATNYTCNGGFYSYRNVAWPSSDPLETTVGGTKLSLRDAAGDYGSERVWNENKGSGGGGISQFYAEPDWQKSLPNQSELKGKRGIPDVSLGAAVNYAFYHSYGGDTTGWSATGGTSIGTPQWAGLVAIADQMAGKLLGFLNPALYKLAGKGFHDITQGNNSLAGVQGYAATTGWDLATGWGTPDAAALVPLLITAVQQTTAHIAQVRLLKKLYYCANPGIAWTGMQEIEAICVSYRAEFRQDFK